MSQENSIEKYFTTRDIANAYPNKFGLQMTFKSFINQRKIRAVKSVRMRIKAGSFGLDRSIPVNCYNAEKLHKAISEYLENPTYHLDNDKRDHLVEILELISKKVEDNLKNILHECSK